VGIDAVFRDMRSQRRQLFKVGLDLPVALVQGFEGRGIKLCAHNILHACRKWVQVPGSIISAVSGSNLMDIKPSQVFMGTRQTASPSMSLRCQ
jgi:hypothetical protein